eukprot:m.241047 g.241047  ORF g.241047 m.241047 type:complete len:56 (+) comp40199_c0_seq19:525-692(+)
MKNGPQMEDRYRSYDTALDWLSDLEKSKENGNGKKKDEPKVTFLQLVSFTSGEIN